MIDLSSRARTAAYWLTVSLLALVPLTFITGVYRTYSLPRFALLLVGSAVLLTLLLVIAALGVNLAVLKSPLTAILCLYVLSVAVSSIFGVAPYVSLLGSFENQMGLLTHLCCFVCFAALGTGIGSSSARFRYVLWAMAGSGLVTSIYAVAQSAGTDPFVPARYYTFRAGAESVVRAVGTIGHADFLGNFLLYTTPLCAGLAFASRDSARRIAAAATIVSIAAIAATGTRGAWVGLAAGAAVYAILEMKSAARLLLRWSTSVRAWLVVVLVLAASAGLISMSPASRSVAARARSFVADKFTGSGRTILWRDSLRMVPSYALKGCGPEGFRKAFLPFKSDQLARTTRKIQNESSHNSYIDAILSYGVPGAALYAVLIICTLVLLLRARRQTADRQLAILFSAVISAFTAEIVHKIFIFDQIPTGLYFFAFAGLALSATVVAKAGTGAATESTKNIARNRALVWVAAATGLAVTVAAIWYSVSLLKADVEIKESVRASAASDFEALAAHGEQAVAAPDPAGGYRFLFERALWEYADPNWKGATSAPPRASAGAAIDLAITHAEKSIARGTSPDLACLLLCHLASAKEDYAALQAYATMGLSWDSSSKPFRSLLAEAFLGQGDSAAAERELAIWVSLGKRGPGSDKHREARVNALIQRSFNLAATGRLVRTRLELLRAKSVSGQACPACHRALALAFEQSAQPALAIEEWEVFMRLDPAGAEAEGAQAKIGVLKQRLLNQTKAP
jgi:O-antigen ligase